MLAQLCIEFVNFKCLTQEVMDYNGSSEAFSIWFNESTKLFRELTSILSQNKRHYLASDAGKLNATLNAVPLFTESQTMSTMLIFFI